MMTEEDQTHGTQQGDDPQKEGVSMEDLADKINQLKASEEESVHDVYKKQLEEVKKERDEAVEKMTRVVADFQNAKRRLEEEKTSFAAFATQKLILNISEVFENYRRLMDHVPEETAETEWLNGLKLIDQQFQKFMDQQGVQLIEPQIGEIINPEHHEAMLAGPGKKEAILEVFSPGYILNNRVIKTAKVKVGDGTEV